MAQISFHKYFKISAHMYLKMSPEYNIEWYKNLRKCSVFLNWYVTKAFAILLLMKNNNAESILVIWLFLCKS